MIKSRFTIDDPHGVPVAAWRCALHISALEKQLLIATRPGLAQRALPFSDTA